MKNNRTIAFIVGLIIGIWIVSTALGQDAYFASDSEDRSILTASYFRMSVDGEEWDDWEETSVKITVDNENNILRIYSKEFQEISFITLEIEEDSELVKTWSGTALDKSGRRIDIGVARDDSEDELVFVIIYSDVSYAYYVEL